MASTLFPALKGQDATPDDIGVGDVEEVEALLVPGGPWVCDREVEDVEPWPRAGGGGG